MSTHGKIDKICGVVLAFTLILTILFMNGERFGISLISRALGYEERLFDTSRVHTLDIVADDWDSFLETCTDEEYIPCSVVIDNESFKNVAIRAKGNTSLTQVKSYGNNRYSFKIEFDAYDEAKTYHGLDKLCLNNIIQDNTYMKDYITYRMMSEFGAISPLCSFVYITVNGEDWGLYLAVEGVEDSFLQRNYGNNYGDLYKPDSMSMGGGRGNGNGFNMDDFKEKFNQSNEESTGSGSDKATAKQEESTTDQSPGNDQFPQMPDGNFPQMPNGDFPQMSGGDFPQMPDGNFPQMSDGNFPQMPNGDFPQMPGDDSQQAPNEDATQAANGDRQEASEDSGKKSSFKGGFGGFSMKSDDVSLIYSNDNYDSYSNIFDNAKTTVTDSDKDRLIASLKSINENTNIENSVDVESVIRYFVVHNFVLNFDSYTGNMIHNYYLYESDGKLSMIPWDYNLAFGGFMSSSGAEGLVNYPIDSPVSGGDIDSRPMLAWIFNNEEYTEKYHELFQSFIAEYFDSGKFSEEFDRVIEMISPYVEKDPTKFCTYDEFVKGSATLKSFCLLRAESINGQLNGTIPSTSDGQKDTSAFVKADGITISDMGSMGNMGKGFKNNDDASASPDRSNNEGTSSDNGAATPASSDSNSATTPAGSSEEGQTNSGRNSRTRPDRSRSSGNSPAQSAGSGDNSATDPAGSSEEGQTNSGRNNRTRPDRSRSSGNNPDQSSDAGNNSATAPAGSSEEGQTDSDGDSRTRPDMTFGNENSDSREWNGNELSSTDIKSTVILLSASFGILIIGILVALLFNTRGKSRRRK